MAAQDTQIVRRDEAQWARVILKHELESLKREKEHLNSKAVERQLTGWEFTRLIAIADEMIELLSKFGSTQPTALAN